MRGRARALLSLAAASLALSAGLVVAPSPAYAAELKLDPAQGPAGTGVTVYFGGFVSTTKCPIAVYWDGPNGTLLTTAAGTATSVGVTVPGKAAVGSHIIYAVQSSDCKSPAARAPFEVTPTPRPSPKPTPTKTVPPTPNPTTAPPVTPSPDTPDTPDTPTQTPIDPTATPTATPSGSPSPTPPGSAEPGGDGELVLDRSNVRPGEPLTATGSGCQPNAPVVLTSDSDQVGTAMSDGTGAFVAPVQFTRLEPGRRIVTASCGVILTTHVDLIVSSSTSGQAGTVVVLIFFVLVGVALLRWQYNSARS